MALSYSFTLSDAITYNIGPLIDPMDPSEGALILCMLGGGNFLLVHIVFSDNIIHRYS